MIQKGRIIVPTSKIEYHDKTIQKNTFTNQKIDAEGVEFKQGQEPIHRTLKLDQKRI